VVLLDLSAAFDLVPPDTLVKKLEIYGLDSDFLAWIESYLSDRHQAVWIDHVMSDFLPMDRLKNFWKRLAGLTYVKFVLPYSLRKFVSEGVFNSVLGYCLPLFGGCDVGEIQDLQILQNKAAQLVTQSPPRAIRNPMYDRLGWLTVNQLITYHTLLAVYRVRLTGEPEYLAESLCNVNRNGHIIFKSTQLTLLKKSFKFRGACNWNGLPNSIRILKNMGAFKKAVKIWIKQHVPRFLD
jgi:hypothetical protein